jgi:hypothetical protein
MAARIDNGRAQLSLNREWPSMSFAASRLKA